MILNVDILLVIIKLTATQIEFQEENPIISTRGGIFKIIYKHSYEFFLIRLKFEPPFQVELHGIMYVIKDTMRKNRKKFWLEIDSIKVICAISIVNIVHGHISNKCKNTLHAHLDSRCIHFLFVLLNFF